MDKIDMEKEKIQEALRKNEKSFENSTPFYINEKGITVSLKDIFDIESVGGEYVTLISVCRNQYDVSRFPEYEKYIKNVLGFTRCYYGLWKDTNNQKTEYEVVYVLPTSENKIIQQHLNLHGILNNGRQQKEALMIFPDGSCKPIRNLKNKKLI